MTTHHAAIHGEHGTAIAKYEASQNTGVVAGVINVFTPATLRKAFGEDPIFAEHFNDDERRILRAARDGDTENVKSLLEKKPELLHTRNAEGFTPLAMAAVGCSKETIKILVDEGAKIKEKFGELKRNCFHLIATKQTSEFPDAIDTLSYLDSEYPDLKNEKEVHGDTSLTLAAQLGDEKIVEFLIQDLEMDKTETGMNGRNVVLSAALASKVKILRYLYSTFPDFVKNGDFDRFKNTALILAAGWADVKTLNFLTDTVKMDVNQTGDQGRNLFLTAVSKRNFGNIAYLHKHYPKLTYAVDCYGNNALDIAYVEDNCKDNKGLDRLISFLNRPCFNNFDEECQSLNRYNIREKSEKFLESEYGTVVQSDSLYRQYQKLVCELFLGPELFCDPMKFYLMHEPVKPVRLPFKTIRSILDGKSAKGTNFYENQTFEVHLFNKITQKTKGRNPINIGFFNDNLDEYWNEKASTLVMPGGDEIYGIGKENRSIRRRGEITFTHSPKKQNTISLVIEPLTGVYKFHWFYDARVAFQPSDTPLTAQTPLKLISK